MRVSRSAVAAFAAIGVLAAAGCGAHSQIPPAGSLPSSTSPAMIAPAPMAKTALLPASVMFAATKKPDVAMQGAAYSQIPGSASLAVAAPDGSLWVLSDSPAGPDKSIWHWANSTWTNVGGLASRLAVARDGTLYALNSGGGIFSWNGSVWTAIAGGASDIAVDYDGSLFVITNGGTPGTDRSIWHYTGTWSASQGAGVRLVSSWDQKGEGWFGGSSGGIYVLTSNGSIYHEVAGTPGFVQLPGLASELTPTIEGGYYVMGYPRFPAGNNIYYFDLDSGSGAYTQQAGNGTSISTNSSALYVISGSGSIYSSPVRAAQTWAFGGSSTSLSVTNGQTPGPANLTPYNNVSLSIQFGQITSGSGVIKISDALNNGDITPNTVPLDNATSGYTPIIYITLFNAGPQTISAGTSVPAITLTKSTGFGSATTCNLDLYIDPGTGTKSWNALPGATAAISGNTVSSPATVLPGGSTVDFQPGDQPALAIACH
jgi:hypothetical protein